MTEYLIIIISILAITFVLGYMLDKLTEYFVVFLILTLIIGTYAGYVYDKQQKEKIEKCIYKYEIKK